MKAVEFKDYTLITPANRKSAIIKGRVVYCIEFIGKSIINYNGSFPIRPRLVKGRLKMKGHPFLPDADTFVNEDETLENYKTSFDALITLLIEKKQLYFKLTDPLIKYETHEINSR
jgi:hypothetical protein